MINKGMMSSIRQDWKTPKKFYEELNKEFGFDFDPCPVSNGGLHKYDMLGSSWGECNFVNPPYNNIGKWLEQGFKEWKKGKTCVFLIPSRTDTKWWHDYCMNATEIRFIKGRLCFDDSGNPAPFPS